MSSIDTNQRETQALGHLAGNVAEYEPPTPVQLLAKVMGIIEQTYAHDEQGNRIHDVAGDYSTADLVDDLVAMQDDILLAIMMHGEPDIETARIVVPAIESLAEAMGDN